MIAIKGACEAVTGNHMEARRGVSMQIPSFLRQF
jgi:hypothetical protein